MDAVDFHGSEHSDDCLGLKVCETEADANLILRSSGGIKSSMYKIILMSALAFPVSEDIFSVARTQDVVSSAAQVTDAADDRRTLELLLRYCAPCS